MGKPTDTQQKEFLEWCGWEQKSETIYGRTVKYWHSPDKNQYSGESRKKLYNPPELDLTFLFKYAVPKIEVDYELEINDDSEMLGKSICLQSKKNRGCSIASPMTYFQTWDELASALFWALWKESE
uniref:Uncharacterized protein n=1 Tax=viral metagenome TaxID=1070528 RepID=A0A6H2A2I9_9ZZZZ